MLIKKIQKKSADPFVYLHGTKITDYEKIPTVGQKIMDGINRLVRTQKIEPTGPAIWSYTPAGKGKLKLRAGVPVKKGTRGKTPFSAKSEPEWTCLSAEYKGPMTQIINAWFELFEAAEKKGIELRDDRREIYRKWVGVDSKENVTELQIRLK